MSLENITGLTILAQSTDTKPTNLDTQQWRLIEKDTGKVYIWNGSEWKFNRIQDEAKEFFASQPRSAFHQLFGDTFAQTEANAVFLLEDLTDEQGGTSLTNNGTIDLTRVEDKLPLRGFNVPSLNGSSQYFSIPTESKVEVGTDSFIAHIRKRIDNVSALRVLFSYGDVQASEQNWLMEFTSGGVLQCTIDDGTNAVTVADTRANIYDDDEYHDFIMFADRTNDTMYLIVDGVIVNSASISAVTLTLNNTGESLYIGARDNAGIEGFSNGKPSNFQLYKNSDEKKLYSLIPILSSGIRESAKKGTVDWSPTNDSNGRINNVFGASSNPTANDYEICVINTDEGYYDLIPLYKTNLNNGITEISIDGITHETIDHESGSAVYNNKPSDIQRIFLGAGSHILKIKETAGQQFRYQMIELIKRDGSDEGGATSGLLLGDELLQKNVGDWSAVIDTSSIYNQYNLNNDANSGDFCEGNIFLKKGLYRVTTWVLQASGTANYTLFVGGNTVLDNVTTSGGTTRNVVKFNGFVFVDGGKTPIQIKASSAGNLQVHAIRFELVSGAGKGDTVEIFGADDDFQTVSGTDSSIVISTSARFNHYRNNATDLLNDEWVYRRYFSGGTYLLKYVYPISLDGGETDVSIDGSVVIDNLDQQGSASFDNEHFTVLEIPRGFIDINIKNVLDGDSSDFQAPFQRLYLQKIADSQDAENDDSFDGEFGELVPLLHYVEKASSASDKTFDFANIDLTEQFSELIVKFKGAFVNAGHLQMQVNGLAGTGYERQGMRTVTGTPTDFDESATAQLILLSSSLNSSGQITSGEIIIKKVDNNVGTQRFIGHGVASSPGLGNEHYIWGYITDINTNILKSLRFFMSASSWRGRFNIDVYGVRRS